MDGAGANPGANGLVSHCMLCGKPGLAGGSCPTCLVALPQPICEPAGPLSCPRCGASLMPIGAGPGAVVYGCSPCSRLFVPPRGWSAVLTRPALADELVARLPQKTARAAELMPMLKCPECRAEMDRARFAATSDVVIDACPRQHGVWLDAGDLPQAVRYVEHLAEVGQVGARREAEVEWARATANDALRTQIESEQAKIRSDSSRRMWKAKRIAVYLGGAALALKICVWAWRASHPRSSHSAVEVEEIVPAGATPASPRGAPRR